MTEDDERHKLMLTPSRYRVRESLRQHDLEFHSREADRLSRTIPRTQRERIIHRGETLGLMASVNALRSAVTRLGGCEDNDKVQFRVIDINLAEARARF